MNSIRFQHLRFVDLHHLQARMLPLHRENFPQSVSNYLNDPCPSGP